MALPGWLLTTALRKKDEEHDLSVFVPSDWCFGSTSHRVT